MNIVASSNTTYLLEKSRVVLQEQGERNYHTFYQFLRGADAAFVKALQIEDFVENPELSKYVNQSGCIDIDDVNDKQEYEHVQHALSSLGFPDDEKKMLASIIAIILHCGNVDFIENSSINDEATFALLSLTHLEVAIRLLGVDESLFKQTLLKKKIKGGKRDSFTYSAYSISQAYENKNSFVKELYARVFDWIVSRINELINSTTDTSDSTKRLSTQSNSGNMIGILDIFGFEIFKHNSFEQLCINLANESLQQFFNYNIFKVEIELYKSEDIPVPKLNYYENQDVLDLIIKKPTGLLPMLDEECLVPRGSWEGYLNKIVRQHFPGNKRFRNKHVTREFSVIHYAGEVQYDPKQFLVKNQDTLSQDIIEALSISTNSFISSLFRINEIDVSIAPPNSSRSQSNKLTVGKKFTMQLEMLIQTLNSTKPHYIRCIKTNSERKANLFMSELTHEQLNYSGVFEAVIILQSGYPFRLSLAEFRSKYHMFVLDKANRDKIFKGDNMDMRQQLRRLISVAIDKYGHSILKDLHLGKTKVFYRGQVQLYLMKTRNEIMRRNAIIIQKHIRGFIFRRIFTRLVDNMKLCEECFFNKNIDLLVTCANNIQVSLDRLNNLTSRVTEDLQLTSDLVPKSRQFVAMLQLEVSACEQLKVLMSNKSLIAENLDELSSIIRNAKSVIHFDNIIAKKKLIYSWSENAYLVSCDVQIETWSHIVENKKRILEGIEMFDEILLDKIIVELKSNSSLDHEDIFNLKDCLREAELVVEKAKQSVLTFISDTSEALAEGRLHVQVTTSNSLESNTEGLLSLKLPEYEVDNVKLISKLTAYASESTTNVFLMKSRRVQACLQLYNMINALRTLAKEKLWSEILKCVPIWSKAIGLKETFSSTNSIALAANINSSSKSGLVAISFLSNFLITCNADLFQEVPLDVFENIKVELQDFTVLAFKYCYYPLLQQELQENCIPQTLYITWIQPIVVSGLEQVLESMGVLEPLFDVGIASNYRLAKEVFILRKGVVSGLERLDDAISQCNSLDHSYHEYKSALQYQTLFSLLNDIDVCVHAKRPIGSPGSIDYEKADVVLMKQVLLVCRHLDVQDDHWSQLVQIFDFVFHVRELTKTLSYQDALIWIAKAKASSSFICSEGISNDIPSDGKEFSIIRVLNALYQELMDVEVDLNHKIHITLLLNQISETSIKGSLDELDFSNTMKANCEELLLRCSQYIVRESEDRKLFQLCTLLVDLRHALSLRDWETIHKLLSIEFRISEQSLVSCNEHIRDELDLIYFDYLNRQTKSRLLNAIAKIELKTTTSYELDSSFLSYPQELFDGLALVIEGARELTKKATYLSHLLVISQILACVYRLVMTQSWFPWDVFYSPFNVRNDYLLEAFEEYVLSLDAKVVISQIMEYKPMTLDENQLVLSCDQLDYSIVDLVEFARSCGIVEELKQKFEVLDLVIIEWKCRIVLWLACLSNQLPKSSGSVLPINATSQETCHVDILKLAIVFVKSLVGLSSYINMLLRHTELLLELRSAILSSRGMESLEAILDINAFDAYLQSMEHETLPMEEMKQIVTSLIDLRARTNIIKSFAFNRPKLFVESKRWSLQLHNRSEMELFPMSNLNINDVDVIAMENALIVAKQIIYPSNGLLILCRSAELNIALRKVIKEISLWNIDNSNPKLPMEVKVSVSSVLNEFQQFRDLLDEDVSLSKDFVEDMELIREEYERQVIFHCLLYALRSYRLHGEPLGLIYDNVQTNELEVSLAEAQSWMLKRFKRCMDIDMNCVLQELVDASEEVLELRKALVDYMNCIDTTSQLVKLIEIKHLNDPLKFLYHMDSWNHINNLLGHFKYAIVFPQEDIRRETSLVQSEMFARIFFTSCLGLFHEIVEYHHSVETSQVEASVLIDFIKRLEDIRTSYYEHLQVFGLYLPNCANMDILSDCCLILMKLLEADDLDAIDISDTRRDWKTPKQSISLLELSNSSSPLSIIDIINCIRLNNIAIHILVEDVVNCFISRIEDMISFQEMSNTLLNTITYINISQRDYQDSRDMMDTLNLIDLSLCNICSMLDVKERIESIGINPKRTLLLNQFQSFQLILSLRQTLLQSSEVCYFDLLKTVYELMRHETHETPLDVHHLIQQVLKMFINETYQSSLHDSIWFEFSVLLRYSIEQCVIILGLQRLRLDSIQGTRVVLEVSELVWDALEAHVAYDDKEMDFPWGKRCRAIFDLCSQLVSLRQLTFASSGIIKQEKEIAKSSIDANTNHGVAIHNLEMFYKTKYTTNIFMKQVNSYVDSHLVIKMELESLLTEVELITRFCEFWIHSTIFLETVALPLMSYSSSGLICFPTTALHEAIKVLDDMQLQSIDLVENWYLDVILVSHQLVDLVDAMIKQSQESIDSFNLPDDLMSFSGLTKIASHLDDVNELEVGNSQPKLVPGTKAFNSLIPLISSLMELVESKDRSLLPNSLNNHLLALQSSLLEHDYIISMKCIVKFFDITSSFDLIHDDVSITKYDFDIVLKQTLVLDEIHSNLSMSQALLKVISWNANTNEFFIDNKLKIVTLSMSSQELDITNVIQQLESFHKDMELSSVYGQIFKVLVGYYLQLYANIHKKAWDEAYIVAQLLSQHQQYFQDINALEMEKALEFINVLRFQRQLEYSIAKVCYYPYHLEGWSDVQVSNYFTCNIPDSMLHLSLVALEAPEHNDLLEKYEVILLPLMKLGRVFFDLIQLIRLRKWVSTNDNILFDEMKEQVESLLKVYVNDESQSIISVISDCIKLLMSSNFCIHPHLFDLIRLTLEALMKEQFHRQLLECLRCEYLCHVDIKGIPGNVFVSNETMLKMNDIISLLEHKIDYNVIWKNNYDEQLHEYFCRLMKECIEDSSFVQSIYWSCKHLQSLVSVLEPRDWESLEKLGELVEVIKRMSRTCCVLDYVSLVQSCLETSLSQDQLIQSTCTSPSLYQHFVDWKNLMEANKLSNATNDYEFYSDFIPFISLLEKHCCYWELSFAFFDSLKDTPASGTPGSLLVSSISINSLEEILTTCQSYQLPLESNNLNSSSHILFRVCLALASLRMAQKHKNITKIVEVLDEIDEVVAMEKTINNYIKDFNEQKSNYIVWSNLEFTKAIEEEIELAKLDRGQHLLMARIKQCLASSGIPSFQCDDESGLPSSSYLENVSLKEINEFFDDINMPIALCEEAKTLLQTLQFVRNLREMFKECRWRTLQLIIDEIRSLPSIEMECAHELVNCQHLVFVYDAIQSSWDCYQYHDKAMDEYEWDPQTQSIYASELEKVIAKFSKVDDRFRTVSVQQHYLNCMHLWKLKCEALNHRWDVVYDIAKVFLHERHQQMIKSTDIVLDCVRDLYVYSSNMICCEMLEGSLRLGQASGTVDSLITSSISIACITAVLNYVSMVLESKLILNKKYRKTIDLIAISEIIRQLRLAQRANKWSKDSFDDLHCLSDVKNKKMFQDFGSLSLDNFLLLAEETESLSFLSFHSQQQMLTTSFRDQLSLQHDESKEELTKESKEFLSQFISSEMLDEFMIDYECIQLTPTRCVEEIVYSSDELVNRLGITCVLHEMSFAKDLLAYRRIVFSLVYGLLTRCPNGSSGNIDIATIDTISLKQVIVYCEQFPRLLSSLHNRSKTKRLLNDIRYLYNIRSSRKQLQWKQLATLLKEVKLNYHQMTCMSIDLDVDVPCELNPMFKAIHNELLLYEGDYQFHLCLAEFVNELNQSHEIQSQCDVEVTNSLPIPSMMKLIDICNQTALASLVCPSNSFDRLIEAEKLAIEFRSHKVYAKEQSMYELITRTRKLIDQEKKSGLMGLPCYIDIVLDCFLYSSQEFDRKTQYQLLEDEVIRGQEYLRCEIGCIFSNSSGMDTLKSHLIKLEDLLNFYEKMMATTMIDDIDSIIQSNTEDLLIVQVVHVIIDIRKTLINGMWQDVDVMIQRHLRLSHELSLDKSIFKCFSLEMNRLSLEIQNNQLLLELKRVFKANWTCLNVFEIAKCIYFNNISFMSKEHQQSFVENIETLIDLIHQGEALASKGQGLSNELLQAIQAANYVYRIRLEFMNREWDKVSSILFNELRDKDILFIQDEISIMRCGFQYRKALSPLIDGLKTGSVQGFIGKYIDISNVSIAKLQIALLDLQGRDVHLLNDELTTFLTTLSQCLVSIRRFILESRHLKDENSLEIEDLMKEFDCLLVEKAMSINMLLEVQVPLTNNSHLSKDSLFSTSSSNWFSNIYKAILFVKEEVSLVAWEMNDWKLRKVLVNAMEHVPPIAKTFELTLLQTNNVNVNVNVNARLHIQESFNKVNLQAFESLVDIPRFLDEKKIAMEEFPLESTESLELSIEVLEEAIALTKTPNVELNSKMPMSDDVNILTNTAELLLKYRKSMLRGIDLESYQMIMEETKRLELSGRLSSSYGVVELQSYKSIVMTVEMTRVELAKAIKLGKVKGYYDVIDLNDIDVKTLSRWISVSRQLMESYNDLANGLKHVYFEALALLMFRSNILNNVSSFHITLAPYWKYIFNSESSIPKLLPHVKKIWSNIEDELVLIYTCCLIREWSSELNSLLSESPVHVVDLDRFDSSLAMKYMLLQEVIRKIKMLQEYQSSLECFSLTMSDTNVSRSQVLDSLQVANDVMKLWSAIYYKHWGASSLASIRSTSQMNDCNDCNDPLISEAIKVFSQGIQESIPTSRVFSPSLRVNANDFESSHRIESFDSLKDEIIAENQILPNTTKSLLTHSIEFYHSISDSTLDLEDDDDDEDEDISLNIDKSNESVLELLQSYSLKMNSFPQAIKTQLVVARTHLLNLAMRLRLIACCKIGRLELDEDGIVSIKNFTTSVNLLRVCLEEFSQLNEFSRDELKQELILLFETQQLLSISKILLNCRLAIIENRYTDLFNELVSIGLLRGISMKRLDFDGIDEFYMKEFENMETFAMELILEDQFSKCLRTLIPLLSKVSTLGLYNITFDVSILDHKDIHTMLISLKEFSYCNISSKYFEYLKEVMNQFVDAIKGCICYNKYRVISAQKIIDDILALQLNLLKQSRNELKLVIETLVRITSS